MVQSGGYVRLTQDEQLRGRWIISFLRRLVSRSSSSSADASGELLSSGDGRLITRSGGGVDQFHANRRDGDWVVQPMDSTTGLLFAYFAGIIIAIDVIIITANTADIADIVDIVWSIITAVAIAARSAAVSNRSTRASVDVRGE